MKRILGYLKRNIIFLAIISFLMFTVYVLADGIATEELKVQQLQTELSNQKQSNERLSSEYTAYKEKMRPFEKDLEQNLAKKQKEEAEQEEKKRAAAKAKLAELEKKKAEEEKKGYETGITFDNLARNPKDYVGKKVKLSGKVIQVSKGTTEHQLRVAIGGNYDTIVMVGYTDSAVEKNVLDNDYITFYGKSVGEITYEATSGASITIPGVLADKIEF